MACCIETGLGLLLGLAVWILDRFGKRGKTAVLEDAVTNVFASFYESATGFSFAIQLACFIIIFAQGGQELGGNGITMQIAWLISTAALLPLVAPTLLLRSRKSADSGQRKGRRRTALTVLVSTILAIYPDTKLIMIVFLAASGYLRDSGSTDGSSTLPTQAESDAITSLCLPSGTPQSSNDVAILTLALVAWLLMTLLFTGAPAALVFMRLVSGRRRNIARNRQNGERRDVVLGNTSVEPQQQQPNKILKLWENFGGQQNPVSSLIAVVLPGAISIALLVEAAQLRWVQQDVAGTSYVDDEWGFGQVAAIAMYGQVVLELYTSVWGVLRGWNRAPERHG